MSRVPHSAFRPALRGPALRGIPRSAGLTLIETLIALSIVALVSVTIVGAISGILSHMSRYSDHTQLELLARALYSNVSASGLPKDLHGFFDTHPDFTWTIKVAPLKEATEGAGRETPGGIKEAVMTVTAPSGNALTFRFLTRGERPR